MKFASESTIQEDGNVPSLKEVAIRVDHVWLTKFGLDEIHDVFEVRLSIVLAIEDASFGKRNLVAHCLGSVSKYMVRYTAPNGTWCLTFRCVNGESAKGTTVSERRVCCLENAKAKAKPRRRGEV